MYCTQLPNRQETYWDPLIEIIRIHSDITCRQMLSFKNRQNDVVEQSILLVIFVTDLSEEIFTSVSNLSETPISTVSADPDNNIYKYPELSPAFHALLLDVGSAAST